MWSLTHVVKHVQLTELTFETWAHLHNVTTSRNENILQRIERTTLSFELDIWLMSLSGFALLAHFLLKSRRELQDAKTHRFKQRHIGRFGGGGEVLQTQCSKLLIWVTSKMKHQVHTLSHTKLEIPDLSKTKQTKQTNKKKTKNKQTRTKKKDKYA